MKIITHNRRAHRDDFLACCIILAEVDISEIRRSEWPTQEELNDNRVFIVDFGKVHDPSKLNFDHHHIQGGEECAFTLILDYFKLRDYDALPWIKYVEIDDHCGPIAVGKFLGNGGRDIKDLIFNPIEEYLIQLFSIETLIIKGDYLYNIMKSIGGVITNQFKNYHNDLAILSNIEITDVNGWRICDARILSREQLHSSAFKKFQRDNKIDIVLSGNDRGTGHFRMTRVTETINFNDAAEVDGVKFVHQSGFLISFDCDWGNIINNCEETKKCN